MAEGARSGRWTRRAAIVGGGLTCLGGAAFLARKPDRGGAHDAYFMNLTRALRQAGVAHPVLVIDQRRLDQNIATVRAALAPRGLPLRVVVKSLPSQPLIDRVARGLATDRFMVFNGAMLRTTAARPGADLLLGKPLPAIEFAETLQQLGPEPLSRVQWLIDTPERLKAYAQIAEAQGVSLRTNFEIDVGLHRGGFVDPAALAEGLSLARGLPVVTVNGLMGYDPHVPSMGDPIAAYRLSQDRYRAAVDVLNQVIGPKPYVLNGAGSPTYAFHVEQGTVANELSVGSAFVKPTHFDTPSLERHVPAACIASPVIKALDRMRLPGHEWLSGPLNAWDPNTRKAFFIYGGNWLATPVSPPGLEFSALFGRSSNQELLTGSDKVDLKPDDYVFLRPTQSEALFLQFGDIAVFNGAEITDFWPTFSVSA